jgi:hypothetical protein
MPRSSDDTAAVTGDKIILSRYNVGNSGTTPVVLAGIANPRCRRQRHLDTKKGLLRDFFRIQVGNLPKSPWDRMQIIWAP